MEFRGEFSPISTSVPGIQISEIFPKVAQVMHKCVVVRSLVGCREDHSPIQCYNGYTVGAPQPMGGRPSMGAIISRLQGNSDASVPSFVGLAPNNIQHVPYRDPGQPGFLGPAHAAFRPDGPGPGLENMTLRDLSIERLNDRRRILESIDDMRRDVDFNSTILGLDSARARALDVLTSNKLVRALDISREPAAVRACYGDGRPHLRPNIGIPPMNEQLLVARRLVEAGVRCVTLTFADWDTHGQNFYWMRYNCARLDQCLSALIDDLDVRGMLDNVTVLVWGEFGRTPRVNGGTGRDHWAPVSCCFMAGGGMRTGQVIGSTTHSARGQKPGPSRTPKSLRQSTTTWVSPRIQRFSIRPPGRFSY